MSFRELRNFTEIMRALGYQRRISVENFREPNFELVADCLFWMTKKYDPSSHIGDDIDSEDDRVQFISSVCTFMLKGARIKLNAKKLYAADGRAVKELLKLARLLYDAHQHEMVRDDEKDAAGDEEATNFSSKAKEVKTARALSTEITGSGAKLFDLLEQEVGLRDTRESALSFLDAISSNLTGETKEHKFIEKSIREMHQNASEQTEGMKKEISQLQQDEKTLSQKIKKKQTDLDRNEKRFKSLKSVRPAFMDEYERLEEELSRQYKVYLERFRNLDYLEFELKNMERAESHQLQDSDRQMQRLQKKLRDEELSLLRGEANRGGRTEMNGGKGDSRQSQARPTSASRKGKGGPAGRGPGGGGKGGKMTGNMGGDMSEDDSEDDGSSGDFSSNEDSEDEVSMGSGASDSELSGSDSGGSEEDSGDFSDDIDDEESDEDF